MKLRPGTIVRIYGKYILGVVVQHEKFLDKPGFYAFNRWPGDKEFIREHGVDWYQRKHIDDLTREGAEIITRRELQAMYKKNPNNELKTLLQITRPCRKPSKK